MSPQDAPGISDQCQPLGPRAAASALLEDLEACVRAREPHNLMRLAAVNRDVGLISCVQHMNAALRRFMTAPASKQLSRFMICTATLRTYEAYTHVHAEACRMATSGRDHGAVVRTVRLQKIIICVRPWTCRVPCMVMFEFEAFWMAKLPVGFNHPQTGKWASSLSRLLYG